MFTVSVITMITKVDTTGKNDELESGEIRMTEAFISQQCKAHRGYTTPELNEKLYLHHFGFSKIENLDPYTGCKVLYITHNALTDLSPLAALIHLDSLYVSNNSISSLESLPVLPVLRQLDVSHNSISECRALASRAPALEILLASHNVMQSLEGLGSLSLLTSLDVSHNKLSGYEEVQKHLARISGTLQTLIFSGNKMVHENKNYRKNTIYQFPALRFLDAYPVFPEERRKAEAFAEGGTEAEKQVSRNIRFEEEYNRKKQLDFFADEREMARQRRLAGGGRTPPTTKYYDDHKLDDVYIPAS
eukprot:gene11039-7672_t